MKSKLLFPFLFAIALVLGAQTVHEPNSDIYRDIERWAVQGYVREFLPITRPYPAPLIDKILDEVSSRGDAEAREKAAKYREMLAPGSRVIHPGLLAYVQGNGDEASFIGAPFVEGMGRLNELFSVSYNLAFYGVTDTTGERFNVPGTYSPYSSFVDDIADIGSLAIRQE